MYKHSSSLPFSSFSVKIILHLDFFNTVMYNVTEFGLPLHSFLSGAFIVKSVLPRFLLCYKVYPLLSITFILRWNCYVERKKTANY